MKLRPHDLVHVEPCKECFVFEDAAAMTELQSIPWVVVRRAQPREGCIPIGVRGRDRSARYAGWMDPQAVRHVDQPEDLLTRTMTCETPAFEALRELKDRWRPFTKPWGPAGSVGFAIASGKPATNAASDLDILIRFSQPVTPDEAKHLLATCAGLPAAVDLQGETPLGGFSLEEFARGCGCLLKTKDGPKIVSCPWQAVLP